MPRAARSAPAPARLLNLVHRRLAGHDWVVQWQRQQPLPPGLPAVCDPGDVVVVSAPVGFDLVLGLEGDRAVVAVFGDLDERTAPCLSSALEAVQVLGGPEVVLDLGGMSALDPVGAGLLAGALYRSAGRLVLRDLQDEPRRALQVSGLYGAFRVEGPEDADDVIDLDRALVHKGIVRPPRNVTAPPTKVS